MSKNIIYCYSGSGNSLDIARNIAKQLGDTDIVMMRSFPTVTDASEAERVGFVFPCYAGGLPGNVEQYVRSIHIHPSAYRFAVVTYAGYPGIGLGVVNDIVGLDYWAGISHHCSCIWLMPHNLTMPMLPVKASQKRSEKLAAKIGQEVKAFQKTGKEKPLTLTINKLESGLWPMLSVKKAAKMTVSDDCVNCGQCAKICPKANITYENGKPVFGGDCIQCLSCLQYCPKKAIHMGGLTKKRARYHNPKVSAADMMKPVIHID